MVETKNSQNCQYSGGSKIYKNMFYVKFSTSSTKYRMLKTILDGTSATNNRYEDIIKILRLIDRAYCENRG